MPCDTFIICAEGLGTVTGTELTMPEMALLELFPATSMSGASGVGVSATGPGVGWGVSFFTISGATSSSGADLEFADAFPAVLSAATPAPCEDDGLGVDEVPLVGGTVDLSEWPGVARGTADTEAADEAGAGAKSETVPVTG